MKEQEPMSNKNELTNQPNSSNLEGEGNVFMPDGTNGGPEQQKEGSAEEPRREEEHSQDNSSQTPPPNANQPASLSEEEKEKLKQKTKREVLQELHDERVHEFAERVRKGEIDVDKATEMFIDQFGTDEQILQEELSAKREETPPEDSLKESFDKIQAATDFREAIEEFSNIRAHVSFIYTDLEKTNDFIDDTHLSDAQKRNFKEWFEKATVFFGKEKDLRDNKDLDGLKSAASELYAGGNLYLFSKEIQRQNQERRGAEKKDDTQPQSLEALIGLIIASEDPKWSTGHEFELINKDKEVQMHNFMEWVRSKIIYHHEFNADAKIDLFSQIYIATPYRQIGLGEIISESGRYFRKQVIDKDTKIVRNEHSDEYQNFKDELLYEVWLFSKNHNYEVDYRTNMGREEKAIETLMAIHFENIFSLNKDRLYRVLTLPSATKDEMKGALDKEREGGSVGKGFRQAELAYNYLYEIGEDHDVEGLTKFGPDGKPIIKNMFENVLGEEGSLAFYKGISEKIIRDKYSKDLKATIEAYDKANKNKHYSQRDDFFKYLLENNADFIKIVNEGYDSKIRFLMDAAQLSNLKLMRFFADGLMKKTYVADPEKGIKDLNIFVQFSNQRYKQDLLKTGIAHAIGKNYDLSVQDAKYADHWAFSMSYWTGLSARNDVKATGYDGLSKLMNFNAYQIKQEEGRSGGGDLEFMNGIQKMVFTMWEGLRVKDETTGNEKTLLEVLQGGRGDDVKLDEDIKPFNFSPGSMQNMLAAQQYSNAYTLYKFYMEERGFDFDKYLTRDNHGRLIVDPKLPESVRKNYLKALRYAFDMGEYYYDRKVRGWRQDENRDLVVETKRLEQFMFSQKILDMKDVMYSRTGVKAIRNAYRPKTNEKGEFIDTNGNVEKNEENAEQVLKGMSRNIAAWTFAMELWKHRRWGAVYKIYTPSEINMIEQYLRSIPLEVEKTDMGAKLKVPYFTEEEFRKIRDVGKVSSGKLDVESGGYAAYDSTMGAFWEMFKKFLEKSF